MYKFNMNWDQTGERLYETGVDRGVLYKVTGGKYGDGVPWNGLSAVNESPSGAEATPIYANNHKYLNLLSAEEYAATIEAYTYPDEFAECDGCAVLGEQKGLTIGQQPRASFGFAYRTLIGNDTETTKHGYKIHLVYGCLAAPSEKDHKSTNSDPEVDPFSWEISTTPVDVDGFEPTSTVEIDSTKVTAKQITAIEEILYGKAPTTPEGDDGVAGRLPLPDEVLTIIKEAV